MSANAWAELGVAGSQRLRPRCPQHDARLDALELVVVGAASAGPRRSAWVSRSSGQRRGLSGQTSPRRPLPFAHACSRRRDPPALRRLSRTRRPADSTGPVPVPFVPRRSSPHVHHHAARHHRLVLGHRDGASPTLQIRHMIAAARRPAYSIPYLSVLVVGSCSRIASASRSRNSALIIQNTIAFVVGATRSRVTALPAELASSRRRRPQRHSAP